MKAQDLKNSILQLAIQGKLVEQREEEGTAKELIEKIKAEKERLIKEGKIKKTKALPEITEEEIPFDIPESWEWVRLGDVVSNKSGVSYKKSDLSIKTDNMVRVLRGGNISDLEYLFKDDDIMIDASFVKNDLLLLKNTLITPAVTSLQHIGKMGRIDKGYDNVAVGGFVLMLIPHIDLDTFSQYMLFALSSYYHRSICRSITNKSGQAFYNLSREKLMNVLIPIPPLEEQKRIVEKIEELMPYVEKYDKAYTEVEELNKKFPEDMQKSILQYAIQGKLVEQREEDGTAEDLYQQIQEEKQKLIKEGKIKKTKQLPEITEDEIPFDIPENWKWVRLQDVGELSRGKSKHRPRNDNRLFENGYFPFVQTGDVARANGLITEYTAKYNKFGIEQSRIWEKGTVCLTIAANIGDVAILDFDACFPDSVVGFNAFSPISSNEYFLYGLMCYKTILDSMSRSTAQKNINIEILSKIAFPLPPLAEQKRIVAKIEELLPYTKQLVKKID